MRKVVLVVLGLLALFTALRAYTQDGDAGRFTLQPSEIAFADSDGAVSLSFGLLDAIDREPRLWNVFPMRLAVVSGDVRAYLALNGFSVLTGRGVSVGVPVRVGTERSGDVVSVGGDVEIDAAVQGSVWALGADVRLGPQAWIGGDVICLGGTIAQQEGATVEGNRVELERVRVPLVGFITSEHAPGAMFLLVEGLRVALFLMVSFVFLHFAPGGVHEVTDALALRWRSSVVSGLVSLIAVPVGAILLVLSRVGILFIPILALVVILLAYWGFVTVAVRVGRWLGMKGYVAGLVGFAILAGPSLLAAILGLILGKQAPGLLRIMRTVGGVVFYLACLWGFGGTLAWLRRRGVSGVPPSRA